MKKQMDVIDKAIKDYLAKVEAAEAKRKEFKAVYSNDEGLRRMRVLNDELDQARADALLILRGACGELEEALAQWARLDGSKLTENAKLLQCGMALSKEQLQALADSYADNYTMLQLIHSYSMEKGLVIPMQTQEDKARLISQLSDLAFYLLRDIKAVFYESGSDAQAYQKETIRLYLQDLQPGGARYEELAKALCW